jgi:hypothetical protein
MLAARPTSSAASNLTFMHFFQASESKDAAIWQRAEH